MERTAAKQIPQINHSCKHVQYGEGLLLYHALVTQSGLQWDSFIWKTDMKYCYIHTFPLFLLYTCKGSSINLNHVHAISSQETY